MTNETQATWPYLRLTLPESADAEQIGRLSQSAVDAGSLGAVTEGYELLLYLPREADDAFIRTVVEAIHAEAETLGWGDLPVTRETLPDQPWATAWKADFKSIPVGETLLVRPDWEMNQASPPEWSERKVIWLRPGFGFGTGRHETTRLALEMLENHLEPGMRVLDFGSGSGILSIAAVRLGASSVTALEVDAEANQNALENFELNHCAHRITLVTGDRPLEEMGHFHLIVANMLPHEALPHLTRIADRLDPEQGKVIYSGFLVEQEGEIEDAFKRAGLVPHNIAQMGEWGALVAALGHHLSVEY